MATEFDYDSFNWSEHFKLDDSSPSGLAWNRTTYSFAEAVKYRQAMIAKLNEQGYGYTESHGQ